MKLTMFIMGVAASMRANSSSVVVECGMTESDMFDALLQFLEHVTDATWVEWEKKINEDRPENRK